MVKKIARQRDNSGEDGERQQRRGGWRSIEIKRKCAMERGERKRNTITFRKPVH